MQLSIPQPCQEDWAAMTPTQQGRHCAACQKEVLDFTSWDLFTIYTFFEKQEQSICGRFRPTQLEAYNTRYQPLPTPSLMRKWAAAAVLTAVVVLPSFGQVDTAAPLPVDTASLPIDSYDKATSPQQQNLVTLSGKVLDVTTGEVLPFTTVVLLDEQENIIAHTQADFNGYFTLQVPPSEKKCLLAALFPGYIPVKHEIIPNQSRVQLTLEFKEMQQMLTGIVVPADYDHKARKKEKRRQARRHKRQQRQIKRLERQTGINTGLLPEE